jgi:hypothetical protein
MELEWDDDKADANAAKHGVCFDDVFAFDWSTALETIDDRADYGENRWIALGRIDTRVHVLVYTTRSDTIRVISLRKANRKEVQHYEQAQT